MRLGGGAEAAGGFDVGDALLALAIGCVARDGADGLRNGAQVAAHHFAYQRIEIGEMFAHCGGRDLDGGGQVGEADCRGAEAGDQACGRLEDGFLALDLAFGLIAQGRNDVHGVFAEDAGWDVHGAQHALV